MQEKTSIKVWSKARPFYPKDNIISHARINQRKFIPSYQKVPTPVNMWDLLSFGYKRQWFTEKNAFRQVELDAVAWKKQQYHMKNKKLLENTKMKNKTIISHA